MKQISYKYKVSVLLIALLFFISAGFIYNFLQLDHKIKLTDESELKINIEAGFGNINVSRGEYSAILEAEIESEKDININDCFNYEKKGNIGYLVINTDIGKDKSSRKKRSFGLSGLKTNNWNLFFTDAIPISYEIELGMGKGRFDLTGLMVKDLNISTGASSFLLRFDKPNRSVIENLTIESGISKFRGIGLSNANFEHLNFEGGVGTYTLDFSGVLLKEADVAVKIGLGSLTIVIPREIGARVKYEKNFMSHIDLDSDFHEQENDSYYSANYYDTKGRLNILIEAGLGSINVKRE